MFNWPQLVALGNILCLDPSTLWMPCKAATYEAAVGVLIHVFTFCHDCRLLYNTATKVDKPENYRERDDHEPG